MEGRKMIEYDFERVEKFWEMVYSECEREGVKIEYRGREGSEGIGDFGKFVGIVENVILKFCEEKY